MNGNHNAGSSNHSCAMPAELLRLTPSELRRKLHGVLQAYPYLRFRVERMSFMPASVHGMTARTIATQIANNVLAGACTAHDLQVIAHLACCELPPRDRPPHDGGTA